MRPYCFSRDTSHCPFAASGRAMAQQPNLAAQVLVIFEQKYSMPSKWHRNWRFGYDLENSFRDDCRATNLLAYSELLISVRL